MIHRDLKPSNLMVGAFGEVLVMDWGIAKQIGTAETDSAEGAFALPGFVADDSLATIDGTIVGTPAYMSPEQATGRVGEIDHRSDIYCLGVILYELLTLERAFVGENTLQVFARLMEGDFPPPRERSRRSTVPRELEAVILKAMALSPSERYTNVPELQADIQAYLDGRTLSAARYNPLQRLVKWGRRHRIPLLVASAALLGAGVLFGLRVRYEALGVQQEFEAALTAAIMAEKRLARFPESRRKSYSVCPVSCSMRSAVPPEVTIRPCSAELYGNSFNAYFFREHNCYLYESYRLSLSA